MELDEAAGHLTDVGEIEEERRRHLDAELFPQTGRDDRRLERCPAEIEEVLVESDAGDAEYLPPGVGETALERRRRRDEAPREGLLRKLVGEPGAVELPAGRDRQTVEKENGGRHLVSREPLGGETPQFGGETRRGGAIGPENDEGDEPGLR